MAEDITKRVDQLREDLTQQQAASMTLLGIVQEGDKKLTEVLGTVRSIQAHEAIVDARLNTIDARINAWSQDMAASFRQVEATVATKEDLAGMEERLDGRMNALDAKMDQVIALLTKQTE